MFNSGGIVPQAPTQEKGQQQQQPNLVSLSSGAVNYENWGESLMPDTSPNTDDTSTDLDPDDKNQMVMFFAEISWISRFPKL